MPPNGVAPSLLLEHELSRVRRRFVLARALSTGTAATVVSIVVLVLLAAVVGPVGGVAKTTLAGLVLAAPIAVFAFVAGKLLRALDAPAVADLYRPRDARLASQARSAIELSRAPAAGESSALVAALVADVVPRIGRITSREVVDVRATLRGPLAALLVTVVAGGVAWKLFDRIRTGTFALVHPGLAAEPGSPRALVVAGVRYVVVPPPHRRLRDRTVEDSPTVSVPEGSRIRVSLRTIVDARRVTLLWPGSELVLRRTGERRFAGEGVVRRGGRLDVRVHANERTLLDARARTISVDEDQSPRVTLELVGAEAPVAPDAEIGFHLEAEDDVGLTRVARVVRLPSGHEWRTPLASSASRTFALDGAIRVSELGLRPGDVVQVFAEATDGDGVRGPKTSRSEGRAIVVASRATERESASRDLRHALDATLSALADRLERPVDATDPNARRTAVAASTTQVIEVIRSLGARTPGVAPTDVSLLVAFAGRVTPLAAREARLDPRDVRALADVDGKLVATFEGGALALADVLAHVELEDAAEIARELDSLRRELVSLVEALRRSDSAEARLRIAADIERARRRMAELASRLSRMGGEVPGEYRNESAAASVPRTEDALTDLERALSANDFDAADRALAALEREVSGLAKAFGEDAEEMGESRFGPRERAFREALEALGGLEAEQATLADETTRVRATTTERALSEATVAATSATRNLAERARRLHGALDALRDARGVPTDREAIEAGSARLEDAEEALRRGDLGAAQESMTRARRAVESMARDLEVSALMFPGREGRTRDAARRARTASDDARALESDVLRAIPRLSDHLDPANRRTLSEGARRQSLAREATSRLAQRFGEEVSGAPLSTEASTALESIARTMREAEQGLGRSDAIAGSDAQRAATERIRALRESLERMSNEGGGGGGEAGGSDGTMAASPTERVEIPGAGSSDDARARRRRVLDAMGGVVPDAYRGAVGRYYEELLR